MGCELERSSLDAIFTLKPDGSIITSSPSGDELLGLLSGEARGESAARFLAGGPSEVRNLLLKLAREGRVREYLTEIVTPAGRRKPIALSASPIRNTSGALIAFVIVAHSLAEVRRLGDELAAKNRFMANILHDSADAILTLDPEDYITSWNKGAEAIFGYGAEEAVGRHLSFLQPPELQSSEELTELKSKLRSQGAVRHQTERLTKDGRRIQVIFTRTVIRDDKGKPVGSSAVLKDVTTFRNLERQLADAEHLATLGELSAGLAHEIKNPLAGIKGAIDVIRDSLPDGVMHREILGDVLHEVNRIDRIVRDLLNYAKPKPPMHSDINLEEIALRIVGMARQSVKSETTVIQFESDGAVPGFTGDESQLEQVLLNLVLNAQSAVGSAGRILVRLGYDPAERIVRMEVEDNGIGVSEEVRKKLFQPFFTTRTDGTGLGLATCLKNVQYHGGTIDIWSVVGQGTRFTVKIPLLSRIQTPVIRVDYPPKTG